MPSGSGCKHSGWAHLRVRPSFVSGPGQRGVGFEAIMLSALQELSCLAMRWQALGCQLEVKPGACRPTWLHTHTLSLPFMVVFALLERACFTYAPA